VVDHDAVLIAADTTRDVLLIRDVFPDARAMDDLAMELWARAEDACEASAQDGIVHSCSTW
jgi:hypothetical protein